MDRLSQLKMDGSTRASLWDSMAYFSVQDSTLSPYIGWQICYFLAQDVIIWVFHFRNCFSLKRVTSPLFMPPSPVSPCSVNEQCAWSLSHVWLLGTWARILCPQDFSDKNTGVGYHFLLQGFFPTQGVNLHLLHCSRFFATEPFWKPHWTTQRYKALGSAWSLGQLWRAPPSIRGSPMVGKGLVINALLPNVSSSSVSFLLFPPPALITRELTKKIPACTCSSWHVSRKAHDTFQINIFCWSDIIRYIKTHNYYSGMLVQIHIAWHGDQCKDLSICSENNEAKGKSLHAGQGLT